MSDGRWERLALVVWALAHAGIARAEVVFSRTCKIYEEPNPSSRVRCVQRAGTQVDYVKNAGDSYFSVETKQCAGFVPNRCISTGVVRRMPKSFAENFQSQFQLGLAPEFDLNWAAMPGSSSHSSGTGLGLQLMALYQFSPSFRVGLLPTLLHSKLSRTFDGSVSIVDPNPPTVSQSVTYGGIGLLGSYLCSEAGPSSIEWWLNGELQYLIPLSGSQTDNLTGTSVTQSVKPSGNPMLFALGMSGEYPVAQQLFLGLGLEGFINIAGTGGNRLFGIRTRLDFHFTL
jgi:hypothetical protein